MTLVTNMPVEQAIPQNSLCDFSAFDISRGIPNEVNFGSDVAISWNGDSRRIVNDLQQRGITIFPCTNRPVKGDTVVVIIEPVSRLLVVRLR